MRGLTDATAALPAMATSKPSQSEESQQCLLSLINNLSLKVTTVVLQMANALPVKTVIS